MNNTVIMDLEMYNSLRDRIRKLEDTVKSQKDRFNNLKIFKCVKRYDGLLSLDFGEDAQQFIDKAFEPFKDTYNVKEKKGNDAIWNYADKKKTQEVE